MKKIALALIAILLISSCSLTHSITLQVTGSGITSSNVAYEVAASTASLTLQTLPWSKTVSGTYGSVSLYADTGSSTTGTVTVTILVDGAQKAASSATAIGQTASTSSLVNFGY